MEYHKTKDILYVMRLLGHKNIKNTLVYTQLIEFKEDEFVCKVAKTVQEASELIENGRSKQVETMIELTKKALD